MVGSHERREKFLHFPFPSGSVAPLSFGPMQLDKTAGWHNENMVDNESIQISREE